MASAKTLLGTASSLTASAVDLRTVAKDLIPNQLQTYIRSAFARLSSRHTIVIEEYLDGLTANQMYHAAETYLGAGASPSARKLRVAKRSHESHDLEVTMQHGEEVTDTFQGVRYKWRLVARGLLQPCRRHHPPPCFCHGTCTTASKLRSFELTFHKKHKDLTLKSYLPFVQERSRAVKEQANSLKFYINEGDSWSTPAILQHPATFAALAMDEELKKAVMEDLARFVKHREYCRSIGKVWKRGYLLSGPAGGGKSSLVAAMANFLRFDVYDLDLTEVRSVSAMRSLVVGMADRSILHVKGVDKRQPPSSDDEEKVTLSGLLNFADRLWSGCGGERIIVLTTNSRERLDPSLLQPGRMDVHMGYCNPAGFRALAKSCHHRIDDHRLFGEIEGLIGEAEVTVAEVVEELMMSDDPDVALKGFLELLKRKKNAACEAKAGEEASEVRSVVRSSQNTRKRRGDDEGQACQDDVSYRKTKRRREEDDEKTARTTATSGMTSYAAEQCCHRCRDVRQIRPYRISKACPVGMNQRRGSHGEMH